jgi:tetratricopeptide (TPR) repeat protein
MNILTALIIASVFAVLSFAQETKKAEPVTPAAEKARQQADPLLRDEPTADVKDAKITAIPGGFHIEWPALASVGGLKLPGNMLGEFKIMFDVPMDKIDFTPPPAETTDILLPLADYWIVRGKPEHAIPLYKRGLEKDPTNITFMNNLAMLLSRVEDKNQEALDLINRALAEKKEDVTLLDSKGLILMNALEFEEASKVMEQAVELSNQHPNYILHFAKLLELQGRSDASRNWFDKARPLLESMPNKLVKENKEMFDHLRMKYAN